MMRKVLLGIGGVIAVAGLAVGVWFGIDWWDKKQMLDQGGESAGALVFSDRVVVFDDVEVTHHDKENNGTTRETTSSKMRAKVIDLATGKQRVVELFNPNLSCVFATEDRMWCADDVDGDALSIRDTRTLKKITTASAEVKKAGLPKPLRFELREPTRAKLLLDDGRIVTFDPTTLAIEAVKPPGTVKDERQWGETTRPTPPKGCPAVGGVEVRKPSLSDDREQLVSTSPAWTVDLKGVCETLWANDSTVYVTQSRGNTRVRAIERASGKMTWEVR
jgi:hypothetical protein